MVQSHRYTYFFLRCKNFHINFDNIDPRVSNLAIRIAYVYIFQLKHLTEKIFRDVEILDLRNFNKVPKFETANAFYYSEYSDYEKNNASNAWL